MFLEIMSGDREGEDIYDFSRSINLKASIEANVPKKTH